MTTYIPFIPSRIAAPNFIATFDDNQYRVAVTWNVSAQRYYINVYDMDGTWICTVPLTQTGVGQKIDSMTYNSDRGVMVGVSQALKWRPLGQVTQYFLEGFAPDALNGYWNCLQIGPNSFSFPIPNPGTVSVLGSVSRLMNMVAGYFQTSSLVFRNSQFEVRP